MHKVASTSMLCQWKRSRQHVTPTPLGNINFSRPKQNENIPQNVDRDDCSEIEHNFASKNVNVYNSAIFTSVVDDDIILTSETDTASENESSCLPEPLTSLFNPQAVNYNRKELNEACEKAFLGYKTENNQAGFDRVTKLTCDQSLSNNWKIHRCGRITASVFSEALHHKLEADSKSLVKKILQYDGDFSTLATHYGNEMEHKARDEYEQDMKCVHDKFNVRLTGLHINEHFPEIGASPDGLVNCTCHGPGLLEIKCPYKYRNGFDKSDTDKNFPLDKFGKIKKSHSYYCQVQGQMLVCNKNYCDFVVWCSMEKYVDRVLRDDVFCKMLLCKLKQVFMQKNLPEIVVRALMPDNDNPNKQYCYCRRPCFEPMVGCDGQDCAIEWFHFPCVDLQRAPRGKWFVRTKYEKLKSENIYIQLFFTVYIYIYTYIFTVKL